MRLGRYARNLYRLDEAQQDVFESLEDGEYAVDEVKQMLAAIKREGPTPPPMPKPKVRTFSGKRLANRQDPPISLLSPDRYPGVSFTIRSCIIVAVRFQDGTAKPRRYSAEILDRDYHWFINHGLVPGVSGQGHFQLHFTDREDVMAGTD